MSNNASKKNINPNNKDSLSKHSFYTYNLVINTCILVLPLSYMLYRTEESFDKTVLIYMIIFFAQICLSIIIAVLLSRFYKIGFILHLISLYIITVVSIFFAIVSFLMGALNNGIAILNLYTLILVIIYLYSAFSSIFAIKYYKDKGDLFN